jgi:hypothetical protein
MTLSEREMPKKRGVTFSLTALVDQTDMLHADTIWRKYKGLFGKLPKDDQIVVQSPNIMEPTSIPGAGTFAS